MMASMIEDSPFSLHLGIKLISAESSRASCSLQLRPEHMNSSGVAHGGLIFALADTCMGHAMRSTLKPGEHTATLESKINYLRPGNGTELRSESQVVHRGHLFANIECRIWVGDQLAASINGTFVIQSDSAKD
jgi:acyl-CoA thioesterase